MTDATRREFLAAAGGALASSAIVSGDQVAAESPKEPTTAKTQMPIPPHRPQTVEGVHAYTDRVSVCAGDTIGFHVSSSIPYELQV